MFGRVTIRLGIGPHSSQSCISSIMFNDMLFVRVSGDFFIV